jgi:toluene-4-monooxygenase system protein B
MMVPLYGFVAGDALGIVVLAHDHETVATVTARLQRAASVRVAPSRHPALYHGSNRLDPALTLAQAGLSALDRVDLLSMED